jgi:N-acylglucosamine-6-phosphate 2-epimerase
MKISFPILEPFTRFNQGLIVSCIAQSGEPLFGSDYMAAMAFAAQTGGASAIRANSPEDIAAIRSRVDLPIIGLYRCPIPGYSVSITPTVAHAEMIATAGADLIELDASQQPHPEGMLVEELIRRVKKVTCKPVIADVATSMEGVLAANMGADAVMTTLAGFHPDGKTGEPDYSLISTLAKRLHIPVIAYGRINSPDRAKKMLDAGAFAVVVGSPITRPNLITERFVKGIQGVE